MSEYHRHMDMVHDMHGWLPANVAPLNTIVIAVDHAGNQSTAVLRVDGWRTNSASQMAHGQPFNVQKWRPVSAFEPKF